MIAALFVESAGVYANLPDVVCWDITRDARLYSGPWPVVAHPPCERWGRFWHGSTRKPHQFTLGDDGGCFAAALAAVRRYNGILEHPKDSHAWDKEFFDLAKPRYGEGWIKADNFGGWTCVIDQAWFGHPARKPTWLYAVGVDLFELPVSRHTQIIPAWMIERYGYAKARRIGVVAMIGGKRKKEIRNRTPEAFRDMLLGMARSAESTDFWADDGALEKSFPR